MNNKFFNNYFQLIQTGIESVNHDDLKAAADKIRTVSQNWNKLIIIGNGGSAAMASHVSVDFTKAAGIRAVNFNEADLLTCFANDYGYERVFEKAIEYMGINNNSTIVTYSKPNLMGASRVWWMFKYFGHNKIAVLDGGIEKWKRENKILTNNLPKKKNHKLL